MNGICNSCKKASTEMKRCAKCHVTCYCSRDCQKADWKAHKKICTKQASERSSESSGGRSTTLSPPKGLEKPIAKPFTRIDNNTYLHDRPEEDVYRVLIDAYRMRIEDEYKLEGNHALDSIYDGASSSIVGFRRFLRQAASRAGLLPPWWTAEKRKACENLGMADGWPDLRCAVEKSDIIEHYGDQRFPMQLRMLAEIIIGRGFDGSNGIMTRRMLMMVEEGDGDSGYTSMHVDRTTGNTTVHT
ncbi:putative MYND domain protein [Nemania sp. FL0916]|nr:putative MYND domain protein [Nemania sp. FL0916]